MRHAVIEAWQDAGWAIWDALVTTAAAIFGKRSHGGKVVRFGRWQWYPKNRPQAREGE